MSYMALEQERRDLKRERPELYEYVTHFECAKALDSAGDSASGATSGHGAANRVWQTAGRHRVRAAAMRESHGRG